MRSMSALAVILFSCISINAVAAEKLVFGMDLVRANDTPKPQAIGEELRKQYVNQDQLLPDTYKPNTIFIRTTDNRQVITNANALVAGLYPPKKRIPNNLIIPLYSLSTKSDNITTAFAFLDLTLNYFHLATQKQVPLKYVLLAGYDSAFSNVLTKLGASAEKNTPATRLNFLLFDNGKDYVVKVRYNNKLVNIPACGGTACTVKQFIELVDKSK